MLLVISRGRSCRRLLAESLQVADAAGRSGVLVGWVVGEQADDVGACGGQDVLYVRLRQSFISAVAQAVSMYRLGDGGLAPGADRVALLPLGCLMLGADPGLNLLERLRQEC